jgi:hypothetical protein
MILGKDHKKVISEKSQIPLCGFVAGFRRGPHATASSSRVRRCDRHLWAPLTHEQASTDLRGRRKSVADPGLGQQILRVVRIALDLFAELIYENAEVFNLAPILRAP